MWQKVEETSDFLQQESLLRKEMIIRATSWGNFIQVAENVTRITQPWIYFFLSDSNREELIFSRILLFEIAVKYHSKRPVLIFRQAGETGI